MKRILVFLTAIFLLSINCNQNQRVIRSNLAYVYYDDPTIVHPQYRAYHKSDSITTLYLMVNSSEVLYSKNNPEKTFLSKMIFSVQVFEIGNDKKMVDSGSVLLIDKGGLEPDKYLVGELDLHLLPGSYYAEVTFDDQYRMQFVQDVVVLDKSNQMKAQNYLILNIKDEIIFNDFVAQDEAVTIRFNGPPRNKIYMSYYNKNGTLPAPPFAVENMTGFNFEPDSLTDIQIDNKNQFNIRLSQEGIYHFQFNESSRDGLTFIVVDGYYPYIKTVEDMLKPMRYITTKQEFQDLADGPGTKKSIDEFWYGIAGNAERARDIIKAFYSRIELTNKYFTSYYPGWKTDRGLIYTIYGPPNVVFRTPHFEKWTYNEKSNSLTEEFTFYKVASPLSENEFYLSRSVGFKSGWYRAIDNWRQGRVF